jgi:hypothetical protein
MYMVPVGPNMFPLMMTCWPPLVTAPIAPGPLKSRITGKSYDVSVGAAPNEAPTITRHANREPTPSVVEHVTIFPGLTIRQLLAVSVIGPFE